MREPPISSPYSLSTARHQPDEQSHHSATIFDLQKDALLAAGVAPDHIYEDRLSGAKDDRPGLAACLRRCEGAIFSSYGVSTGSGEACAAAASARRDLEEAAS